MRVPPKIELDRVLHATLGYDPAEAPAYYERTKKIKGRRRGSSIETHTERRRGSSADPRTGKKQVEIVRNAKALQRKELVQQIKNLEDRLNRLEAMMKKRAHADASEDRKGKAKQER